MTTGTRTDPLPNRTTKTEPKVWAATGGGTAGYVVASVILWALDAYVFTPGTEGDMPWQITGAVQLACTAGLAWLAGRRARHQYRAAEVPLPLADDSGNERLAGPQ